MKTFGYKAALVVTALFFSGTAAADNDFGVGVKAGTLGLGLEASWQPLPYLELRLGATQYDFDDDGSQAGIDYDATLALEQYYATANFRFPLSPMRVTAGLYSNGNELQMVNNDLQDVEVGGVVYPGAGVGVLDSTASFDSTAPYLGIGFDFTLFDKVGMNLDFGVLWQGDPGVSLTASGPLAQDAGFQAALENERRELEDEVSDFKAWPVVQLGVVYKF
ncbi:MAG: hypothetical protein AAF351_07910 [Pseudomonadota bacterium]